MGDSVEAVGEFVEIDAPHRLVFTWGWTHDPAVPPGSTRVVAPLHAEDGGRVVLRHYDLSAHDQAGHNQRGHRGKGWELYLGRLGCIIQSDDPGPDPAPERRLAS